jgi:hypothetical protein
VPLVQVIVEALKLRELTVSQHVRSNASRPQQVADELAVLHATLTSQSGGGDRGGSGGSGGGASDVRRNISRTTAGVVGIIVHLPPPAAASWTERFLPRRDHWLALAPRGDGGAWLNCDSKLLAPRPVTERAASPRGPAVAVAAPGDDGSVGALVAFLGVLVRQQAAPAFVGVPGGGPGTTEGAAEGSPATGL